MDNIEEFPCERAARRKSLPPGEGAQAILILPVIYREPPEESTTATEKKSLLPARRHETVAFAKEGAPSAAGGSRNSAPLHPILAIAGHAASGESGAARPVLQSDGKLAYAKIQHSMIQFEKTIAALCKESDNSSPAIPRFREIYREIMTALPVIAPSKPE
jgi:hypothetical protein